MIEEVITKAVFISMVIAEHFTHIISDKPSQDKYVAYAISSHAELGSRCLYNTNVTSPSDSKAFKILINLGIYMKHDIFFVQC